MAEQENILTRLGKLFQNQIVVRKTPTGQLKVKDVNFQQQGLTSNFIDRYQRLMGGNNTFGSRYAAKENAKIAIQAQELDIKRQGQVIDAQQKGVTTALKAQKGVDDRTSREALKQLDIMTKLAIEEEKIQLEQQKMLFDSAKKQVDVEQKEDKEALKFIKDINK